MDRAEHDRVLELRNRAEHWREMADRMASKPDAEQVRTYADDLDKRANEIERADGPCNRGG